MRKLLFTTGSPFARGVRVVLAEIGLEFEPIEEITTPTPEARAAHTPTLQVPTFWDGDLVLWESGLIAEYLVTTYSERTGSAPPLMATAFRKECLWEDRRTLATVQTLGTAVTTISQMTWSGVRFTDAAYLQTSATRIGYLLDDLQGRIVAGGGLCGGELSIADIFLTCHLGFAANRPLGLDTDWSKWPAVDALIRRCEERESFIANPVRWWEPGVTGYDAAGEPIYANP